MGFFRQFVTLFWKNVLLSFRNWKSSIAQILSPLVIVLLLLGTPYFYLIFPFKLFKLFVTQ